MNVAVVLAGGKGLRLGNEIPKQMLLLGNKPVISWSVDTFHNHKNIDKIIIVSEKSLISDIRVVFPVNKYPKISSIIDGGAERSDSSFNALCSTTFDNDDIILFHDAARPFVSGNIITDIINNVKTSGACGTYLLSTDTVAIISDSKVKEIPERKSVYSAQTPQAFRYDIIKNAHDYQNKYKYTAVTDDVSLVFNMGIEVSSVIGSFTNIKITTELDFKFAEYLISAGNLC